MSMSEDVARYVQAGLAEDHSEYDRDFFIDAVTKYVAKLRADKTAIPAIRRGLAADGKLTYWHYIIRKNEDGVVTQSHGECHDDECFNISKPCPPC
jgi:hypothetical protein